MAKVAFKMPEEFLNKLTELNSKADEIIPKVLEAGGEVVYQKIKSNLSSVVGANLKFEGRSTGELERSLGVSPVKVDQNRVYNLKIGFSEPRSDGKSNAMLANILEYGKHGQPPKPFLKPAKIQCKSACIEAMKSKLESEMNNI
ncbi:MAG: HK97-gp10 family putative phage morphogenesis protein [Thermodesulforhabdaceae bacterium]